MRFFRIFLSVLLFVCVLNVVFSHTFGYAQTSANVECPYFSIPIIENASNDAIAVLNVQYVLKTFEGFNIELTGIYDKQTIDAVRLFQEGYSADILVPWGLTRPTGNVSVTTLHKMRELYCKDESGFSEKELTMMYAIQKKYGVYNDTGTSSATTTSAVQSTLNTDFVENRLLGTPIGAMNIFALPILVILFILLPIQSYYLWGIAPHRKIRLIPREFK